MAASRKRKMEKRKRESLAICNSHKAEGGGNNFTEKELVVAQKRTTKFGKYSKEGKRRKRGKSIHESRRP